LITDAAGCGLLLLLLLVEAADQIITEMLTTEPVWSIASVAETQTCTVAVNLSAPTCG